MTNVYIALRYSKLLTASIFSLLLLLQLNFGAHASEGYHMIPLPLEERTKQSEFIIEGEVLSKNSFWDEQHENIYTSNIIKVYKVFKGEVREQQVEVITEGGAVGLKMHVFSSALELQPGQQGVFFLSTEQQLRTTSAGKPLVTRAYGGQQGFINYDLRAGSAKGVFENFSTVREVYHAITSRTRQNYRTVTENERLRDTAINNPEQQEQALRLVPVITNFAPTVASAGTGTILTINGSNFGSSRGNGAVEFRNSDDGGQTFIRPLPRDYVSWSNTQIRVRIPSRGIDGGTAGTGNIRVIGADGSTTVSSGSLTIEYAYSNVNFSNRAFRPILIDTDGTGGYNLQFAPSMQTRNAAQEGFRRAMNSWICNTNINWRVGEPTSVDRATDDGLNIIRFAPGSETGQGVLARTVSRYEGCSNSNTGDTLFWLSEFDMEINSNINWQYGPGGPVNRQYDYETVVLHELGHAHQLSHVILPRAIMHYAIEFEVLIRDLSTADIAGANLIMARSSGANFCDQPPLIPRTDGDCNLAPEVYTFDAAFNNAGAVDILWTTSQERGINSFVVQRSQDGTTWTDIGTVAARGPNSGFLNYTFADPNPLPRVSYYRLLIAYANGETAFSSRARVINPESLRVLTVFPNPTNPNTQVLRLEYIVRQSSRMALQLYDANGRLKKDFTINFTDANRPVEIDVNDLAAGIYILRWSEGTQSGTIKIMKL